MDYVAHFEAKLLQTKSSIFFTKNAPPIVFPENTFSIRIFFLHCPLTYFPSQKRLWRISRKKCHGRKLRSLLPKTPGNRFSKWRVSRLYFFTKPPPHSFSRPNRLFGAFWGKIVPNVKFARFLRKTAMKSHFQKKHVSFRMFLRNSTLTYFWSQMDYVARFEEKFSRKKTSLAFA